MHVSDMAPFSLEVKGDTYFHWLKICIQTNVLKTTVLRAVSASSSEKSIIDFRIDFPAKFRIRVTTSW
jgi:hypothetical protein